MRQGKGAGGERENKRNSTAIEDIEQNSGAYQIWQYTYRKRVICGHSKEEKSKSQRSLSPSNQTKSILAHSINIIKLI